MASSYEAHHFSWQTAVFHSYITFFTLKQSQCVLLSPRLAGSHAWMDGAASCKKLVESTIQLCIQRERESRPALLELSCNSLHTIMHGLAALAKHVGDLLLAATIRN